VSPRNAPHRPPAPTAGGGGVQALAALRRLLVPLALLALAGCAAMQPESADGNAAKPPPQLQLTVVAPEELKRLLETHLDLARLAIVAPGEALSDAELRRLEAAAPAQARSILATRGHMDAEVKVERVATAPGELPHVRITVTPGARSRVVQVELKLQGALADAAARGDASATATLAAWHKAWALPAGSEFTDPAWRAAKTSALTHLRAAGYAAPRWHDSSAEADADQATVQLDLTADSGPLFLTGPLVVEGLARQDEQVVRNLAHFPAGTPATEALLLDYQERLQRVGLFERVSVTLATDPARADAAPVNVSLGEAPLQQATVGVGYSTTDGFRVSLEHLHRRTLDRPLMMRNKLEVGERRQAWEGELSTHTLPGLHRNLIGGEIESQVSDTDRVTSLSMRVGRAYDSRRIERLVFVELERTYSEPLVAVPEGADVNPDTLAATVNFNGTWRDVDSVLLPTRGQTYALESGMGFVRSNAGSQASGEFVRLRGRLQAWRPLGGNWHGQARLELGEVYAKAAVDVPDTQRFRAGGDESVRGYAYRSLTPQIDGVDVGGRVVATGSLEIAHPISATLPSLWGAAFVDAGNAANSWKEWRAALGAGVGVRWRTPVGPLRADIAYGEEVKAWRLHLSVGVAL